MISMNCHLSNFGSKFLTTDSISTRSFFNHFSISTKAIHYKLNILQPPFSLKYQFLVFCLFLAIASYSQTGYSLQGKVVSVKNEAIVNADVILINSTDTTIKTGALTDEEGIFYFDDLKNGHYKIQIVFVGYQTANINPVIIKGRNELLKPAILHQQVIKIDEVKVFSEKRVSDSQTGKTIYYMEGNLNAAGQTALDLMQTIPMLGVDENDRVTLRGTRVTLLINEVENELSNMLDQIPSESVESIEVISNPSVKYESKSGGGIVNVKLKKNANWGYNGKVLAGLGTQKKESLSAQLGYNRSKWKFSSSIDFLGDEKIIDSKNTRESSTKGQQRFMVQDRNNVNHNNSVLFRNSVSYYLDEKSFIGLQHTLQDKTQEYTSNYQTDQFDSGHKLLSNSSTTIGGETNRFFNQLSTNFHKVFKEGNTHVFDINLLYSFSNPENQYNQKIQPLSIDKKLPMNRYTIDEREYADDEWLIKLKTDYSRPISKKFKIETGVLSSLNRFTEDYASIRSIFVRKNATSSYNLSTKSEIQSTFNYTGYALSSYGLFSGELGKYQLNAGLRFELTVNESESEEVKNCSFYKLLPSLHVKKISSNIYNWELSYTSRILPPNSKQLNPIVTSQGYYFKSMGNIYLKPEVIYQAEFANNWIKKKNNYYLAFYARNRTNVIGKWYFIEKDDSDRDVSISVDENLGSIFTSGFDANVSLTYRKIVFRPSVSTLYNRIDGDKFGPGSDRDQVSIIAKITCDYKFTKNLVAILSGRYNSPIISENGKQFEYYTFDLGFTAKMFRQKASVSVKGADIFNTIEYDRVINQRADYTSRNHIDPHDFLLYVELSYKFGRVINKEK